MLMVLLLSGSGGICGLNRSPLCRYAPSAVASVHHMCLDREADNALDFQPAVSLLQTMVTIPYLLSTTHLIHPVIELIIELILVLITAFPIVFCATVAGPLQQWQSVQANSNHIEIAGIMELVGFIGLCLLEVFHFGFFVCACCRAHTRRRDKIARARAAAMKLEAGWGMNEDEDIGIGEAEVQDEMRQPQPESRRQSNDVIAPPSLAEWKWKTSEESPQAERTADVARIPSSASALSTWVDDRRPSTRRPSSLELTPHGRRRTEASQIGMAIGKPHEIWVPITELRSESPFSQHRVVDDHEVVIVGDGEVKVVSTPREEVFMGFRMPELSTPKFGEERRGSEKEVEADKMVTESPDPDMPRPLKVRKSVKSFKLGNSWELDGESKPQPPVVDQGW